MPAFGGIVYGLSQLGQESAAGSSVAIGSLAVGVVCLLAFGVRQRRLARGDGSPLLDLRPFGYRMFSLSLALLCVAMLSLFGMIILLPIYLQTVRGIGSLPTGLMLLPGGLLMGLLGPTVGKIFDRYGPKALTTGGAAVLTFTMWRFSTVDATTPIWLLVGLHVLMMRGAGLPVHPVVHHRAEPVAAVPLLPRQRDHGHPAAGRRRRGGRVAGGDHGRHGPRR